MLRRIEFWGLVADSPANNLGGVSAAHFSRSGLSAAGQAYLRLSGRKVMEVTLVKGTRFSLIDPIVNVERLRP